MSLVLNVVLVGLCMCTAIEVLPVDGSFEPSVYICMSVVWFSWMYWRAMFLVYAGKSCLDVRLLILVSVFGVGREAIGMVLYRGFGGGVILFNLCWAINDFTRFPKGFARLIRKELRPGFWFWAVFQV